MSTSIKELTILQILFRRPSIAAGVLFIITVIALNPFYNAIMALLAIPVYWAMYQSRRYIYNLGFARYSFLIFLFYIPFVIALFINIDYRDMETISQLRQINILDLLRYRDYSGNVEGWLIANLDGFFHWKMIVFTPSIAAILYFIVVEFDRKVVKKSDLQSLGITEADIFRNNDNIFNEVSVICFIFVSFLFGFVCFMSALLITVVYYSRRIRLDFYAYGALIIATVLLEWYYINFNYEVFLSIPSQLWTNTINVAIKDGYLELFTMYFNWGLHDNFGQVYILVPYLVMTGISLLKYNFNYSKLLESNANLSKPIKSFNTEESIEFGYEVFNMRRQVKLTHKELNTHMYINGASGSGKTVAMLNFVIEAAEKEIPLIYIDGKGATDLEEKISNIADKYNRTFKVFTLSPDAVPHTCAYDFLGSGTFTEKKNRIMNLFIQADAAGVSYYQDNLEMFINRVFMVIHQNQLKIDLFRFLTLISNINDLVELAKQDIFLEDGSKVNWKSYFEDIRDMKPEQSPRTRIITKLDPFIHSSYGHLFNVIGKDNIINLKESIRNGEIVLFLFDASAFALDTERVAKMVISDINATFAEFGKEKNPIKTFCCFDEFKSYETDAISKTISLHRSNGMHAIIGTQSLALINKDIGNGILSNCQTHLVMASADSDAMRFSEEFGKMSDVEVTTRIKADVNEVSDISTRWVMDYKIDKQAIKDIQVHTGQGFLHRKAVGMAPVKIQVTQKI